MTEKPIKEEKPKKRKQLDLGEKLPRCERCEKNPFHCRCGTWEDLEK